MKIPFMGSTQLLIIATIVLFVLSILVIRAIKKSNKKNSKIKENMWLVVFIIYSLFAFVTTNKILISLIISAVITGAVALIINSGSGVINDIKSQENKNRGIKGLVIILVVTLGAIAIYTATLCSGITNKSPRCINCGRNAMWTETGYCYSCYNDVKDKIEDSMK